MTLCPHCERKIYCFYGICPHCSMPITEYFSPSSFFRENFQLFTIIGVIGTTIALLPNFAEKILGTDWICPGSAYTFLTTFLAISTIFGGSIILIIFLIILSKIFKCREKEQIESKIGKLSIRRGDSYRLILFSCISLMAGGFLYFIGFTSFFYPNLYGSLTTIIAILILLYFLVLILNRYLSKIIPILLIFQPEAPPRDKFRKAFLILLILYIALYIFVLFLFPRALNYPTQVSIQADQQYFFPSIYANDGVILVRTNASSTDYKLTWGQWTTNYGYFISKNGNCPIVILGNGTATLKQEAIWTYPFGDIGKNKPQVQIHLELFDENQKPLLVNTSLNITWFDTDIAKIN